jgi:5'-3' exonuclease
VRLHLVDGTFELYRAHFSPRPDAPDKAIRGLVASLRALLRDEEEAVTHLAVAFDNPIRSFRNDLYAGYKSDEGVPPELRAQFDAAEEAVRALGVCVWSMDRFEADDAIGTAAMRFADDVQQVRILSPDKDFGQVLRGSRVVLVDRIRKAVIDEDAYRAKHGVGPKSVPDYLALVGDAADGIPGVPGIGEKTAAALLARYEKLERIPKDPGAWDVRVRGADRVAAALREHAQSARLWRTLATIVTDVPLEEDLGALAIVR